MPFSSIAQPNDWLGMNGTMRILHLEDDPRHADLVASALDSDGFQCAITRVTTECDFIALLRAEAFDLILADYAHPAFDGISALTTASRIAPHVPFIVLSGPLGEETAIETLKAGATDFILKQRLCRLAPAVKRAVREAAHRREQRKAEAALRDSRERLALALRSSGIGVWSWEGEAGTFSWDLRMRELLEVDDDEPADLGSFLSRIHREDRERVESSIRSAREQGAKEYPFEYRVPTRDGSVRHVASRGRFVLGEGDDEGRAIGVAWDVTGEKQEGQQRRLLSTVLESAANAVMITDPEGRISWINAAFSELTGYKLEEVRGQTPRILKSGKHDNDFYREMWQAISRGDTWQGQIVNRRKDGTLYTEAMTISPVRGPYGETVNFVCMKRDITFELDLERQLHQSQRLEAVGRLAGGVAHDFNNILTVISGNADLALETLSREDPTAQSLREISEAARRAATLTRQLLAFSRKQILQPRVLDLNALVAGTEKMLRRVIGEDVKLKTVLRPDLGSIKADPGQLEQILMNLAVNARDAMPTGGELVFETENEEIQETQAGPRGVRVRSGRYVKLAVTDSGQGMDEETLSRIFEPFFTTKEKGRGTGLGLSTVYGIVKQSDGYIWVQSQPGKGTTFFVYFPQVDDDPKPIRTETAVIAGRGAETILVVEDDAEVLRLARSILERSGYVVLAAGSGADALRLMEERTERVDLLLTDVVMPGMSGRALAGGMQLLCEGIRVLYTSGYTDDAIVQHGVLDAEASLLEKPYSQQSLLDAVRKVLDSAPRRS
jgi:PAS domain S-box-containing protein